MAFEAPDYSARGVREFMDFIEPVSFKGRMDAGELLLWGACDKARLVGVAALRDPDHVSLLFVAADFHRRGIARALVHEMACHAATRHSGRLTVNASPYAVQAYRRMGFAETGAETIQNGLRFTPMAKELPGP